MSHYRKGAHLTFWPHLGHWETPSSSRFPHLGHLYLATSRAIWASDLAFLLAATFCTSFWTLPMLMMGRFFDSFFFSYTKHHHTFIHKVHIVLIFIDQNSKINPCLITCFTSLEETN